MFPIALCASLVMLAAVGAQVAVPAPGAAPPPGVDERVAERVAALTAARVDAAGTDTRTQQVPIGTGEISGIVTAADTGRPLQNVMLTLTGSTDVRPASAASRGTPLPTGGRAGSAGSLSAAAPGGLSLNRIAVTDRQGQFVFAKLPAGRFTLVAIRSQFLAISYGARGPGKQGKSIVLRAGQRAALTIAMIRGSVVSGVVTGEDGEPQGSARVQTYRYTFVNGTRRLQVLGGAITDDRGAYRVTNLQPGDYLVAATPNNSDLVQVERAAGERAAFEAAVSAVERNGSIYGPEVVAISTNPMSADSASAAYAPTYYPGVATAAAATTITLGLGEERASVDIRTQSVKASTIQGTVNLPPGFAFVVTVSLLSSEPELSGMTQAVARVGPDGTFTLRSVAPGNYVVTAQTTATTATSAASVPRGANTMWARVEVTVDGFSNPTVALELRPARSISGQVFSDTAQPDPARGRPSVTLMPAGDSNAAYRPIEPAQVQPDGSFKLEGVVPGRYSARVLQAKSVVINGVDILDFPLEFTGEQDITGAVVTLSDRMSSLTGRISESNGEPAYDYTIVIVPDDPRYWVPNSRRIATARPLNGGQFTFGNLPAGGYYLAALTDLENGAQYDRAFLKELTGAAMRVTIADGQRQVQDIRVR